ncbi:MAG: hypothetical protein AAFV54_13145, partial [Pseudomonadota bacterium]
MTSSFADNMMSSSLPGGVQPAELIEMLTKPLVAGPMEQFEIHRYIPLPFGNLDLSFTNSSLWMVIAVGLALLFFTVATRSSSLIPGRAQSVAELSYDFVADMVRGAIGQEGMKF